MSKSDGVPKNDLNPSSPNPEPGTANLNPGSDGGSHWWGTATPGGLFPGKDGLNEELKPGFGNMTRCSHLQLERHDGRLVCAHCGKRPLEWTLSDPPPEALNDTVSDDATGTTEAPGGSAQVSAGLEAEMAILRESVWRVIQQRDELERRLTDLVSQGRACGVSFEAATKEARTLTDVDRAVLLAACSSRARELGERAGTWLRTEMTESAAVELERTKTSMRELMTVVAKVLPETAYLVGSEYESACMGMRDQLEFGVGGALPPPPAGEEIPW